MLSIYLYYCFLPLIFTNDETFNMFLNEDPILVSIIILVPTIIHGILTYAIINKIIYIYYPFIFFKFITNLCPVN
jgi:hypothetical protein